MKQVEEPRLKYFVPEYGNYYHFMAESGMGLYRMLRDNDQLHEKDCEIWYKGRYGAIVQLFSRYPVHFVERPSQVPHYVTELQHLRPNNHEDWVQLRPYRDFLSDMFPYEPAPHGITIIKRCGRRVYSDHEKLVELLHEFRLPVREAIMEDLSLGQQINLMRNTRILVGPHGSGETNLMFMPDRSLIMEFFPKGFIDRVFSGLGKAFGHTFLEIESEIPSVIGRKPSARVQEFFDANGWPTRRDFRGWRPDCMEMGRILRDVASFSLDPRIIMNQLREAIPKLDW